MLTIRMQRVGRKGVPSYRVVVQDIRQTPTSGKYVAMLGSYDPHSKTSAIEKEKAEFYLKNGARPSDRVIRLLKAEGIEMPAWVKEPTQYTRSIRNPEKLRKNRPAEEAPAEEPAAETPAEEAIEQPAAEEAPAEEKPEEPEAEEASTEEEPEAEEASAEETEHK